MTLTLSSLVLPGKPTIADFRQALLRTPLTHPEYDSFLEHWAKLIRLAAGYLRISLSPMGGCYPAALTSGRKGIARHGSFLC